MPHQRANSIENSEKEIKKVPRKRVSFEARKKLFILIFFISNNFFLKITQLHGTWTPVILTIVDGTSSIIKQKSCTDLPHLTSLRRIIGTKGTLSTWSNAKLIRKISYLRRLQIIHLQLDSVKDSWIMT